MSRPAKMSPILPTPWTPTPAVAQQLQVVRRGRLEREVVAPRRTRVGARRRPRTAARSPAPRRARRSAWRGPCGSAAYSSSTGTVVLVGGDLEHAVGRRVDDPAAGPLVLARPALDDLGAGCRRVADHARGRCGGRSRRSASAGKPSGKVGNGRSSDDAHHLPVPGGGVHALAALDQPAPHRRRVRPRWAAGERHHVAQPQRLQAGTLEAADRLGHVAPACSSRRCRTRRRPAGRRRRRRRARSRTPGACGKPTGRVRACGRTAARRRAGRPPGRAPERSWPAAEPAGR